MSVVTSSSVLPFNMKADTSNLGTTWKKWIDRFDNYLLAIGITSEARKKAMLLHFAGEDVYDLFISLPDVSSNITDPPPSEYDLAKQKLTAYFQPKVNVDFEIFNFRQAKQSEDETVNQFYVRLLQLSKTCSFTDPNNEIKSQIILNTSNSKLRRFGLTEKPTLEKLLERAKTLETTKSQMKQIEDTQPSHKINKLVKKSNTKTYNKSPENNRKQCLNCGNRWHINGLQECPARKVKCHSCGKEGHFSKVCITSKKKAGNKTYKKGNKQEERINSNRFEEEEKESSGSSESSFSLVTNNMTKLPTVSLMLNGTKQKFIVDTGSTVNLISKNTFKEIPQQTLVKDVSVIYPYNTNQHLKLLGKFTGTFNYRDVQTQAEVFVVDGNGESLLSCKTCQALGLVQLSLNNTQPLIDLDYIKQKFPKVVQGIGKLVNYKVKLHIDESVPPIAQKHRRIPFHLRTKIEEELERLKNQDIIEESEGPTPWVSPIVIVPKQNNPNVIRMCVDMRCANQAIKRERHITPTIDDLISLLNGATVFRKIDLKDGYHQLMLDESSRPITTFTTHAGLFRYKTFFWNQRSS